MPKPDCYECAFVKDIPGDAHKSCSCPTPHKVKGNPIGIRGGWFFYPYNFDPLWVMECDGFVKVEQEE